MKSIAQLIAEELNVRVVQVDAAVALLDDKATVPFIARYRKEATGGLDDTQLRTLEERLTYLRDLDDRRCAILKSIEEQGKLTPELAAAIRDAATKARLEDLYLPYKVKRRTKAQIAREAGLEPLAHALWHDPTLNPEATASSYVDTDKGIADAAAALGDLHGDAAQAAPDRDRVEEGFRHGAGASRLRRAAQGQATPLSRAGGAPSGSRR